jgi:hypothetical protein
VLRAVATLVAVVCVASCSGAGSASVPAARTSATSPVTAVVSGVPLTPGVALRRLARAHHAFGVAGPVRGATGLYAAYSLRPSGSAFSDDHLIVLRWRDHHWVLDGRLGSPPEGPKIGKRQFRNFPANPGLRAATVTGASGQAPVFAGTEGGGGGWGFMAAVRVHGHWRWARFSGCIGPGRCPPVRRHSVQTNDGQVHHEGVMSLVPNCRPDCGASRLFYLNSWRWQPRRNVFVLTHRRVLTRAEASCKPNRRWWC